MRRSNILLKLIFILLNLLVLNTAFFSAYFLKFGGFENFSLINEDYSFYLLAINVFYFSILSLNRNYGVQREILITKVIKRLIIDVFFLIFVIFSLIIITKSFIYSRLFQVYFISLLSTFSIIVRVLYFKVITLYRLSGRNYRTICIIGDRDEVGKFVDMLELHPQFGYKIEALFCDGNKNYKSYTVLDKGDINSVLENRSFDQAFLVYSDTNMTEMRNIGRFLETKGIRLRIVPDFLMGKLARHFSLDILGGFSILSIRKEPLEIINNYIIKRSLDICFSLTFLLLIFPFMYLIVGLIIKLSTGGKIIFKQIRTGLSGKDFVCYKFTTFNNNGGSKQAEEMDNRVSSFGRFLRNRSIDEFPQFINVLKGDMSIIGPRPHMKEHTQEYRNIISKYMVRHFCVPGITGWAQVNGLRGNTSDVSLMEKRVEYDIYYLENWSIFLDFKIYLMTIKKILIGDKKAY